MKADFVMPPLFELPTTEAGWTNLYTRYVRDVTRHQAVLPNPTLRICLAVAGATLDRGLPTAPISREAFATATGLSDESVGRGIKDAVARGFIVRIRLGRYACSMPHEVKQ